MIEFKVDVLGRKITIRSNNSEKAIRGNGFFFLSFLLTLEAGNYASLSQMRLLPKWRKMKVASVGKQVARIIDNLLADGFDFIEWANKTDSWRIKEKVLETIDGETISLAAEAIKSRDESEPEIYCKADHDEVVRWFIPATKSLLAFTQGDAQKAEELIKSAYKATKDPFLSGVSTPVFTRIGQFKRTPHVEIPAEVSGHMDMFELAIEARVAALQSARANSAEWEKRYQDLERLHGRLRIGGDFTSLARVTQGLAILAKRLGFKKKSEDYAKEAAALAFFSGDLIMIQSAAFNLGNILCENHRNGDNSINSEDYIALLELDVLLRNETSFGQNRAQSNLVLAYIHFLNDDYDRASLQLEEARGLIEKAKLHIDEGLYYNVKGLLELKRAKQTNSPIKPALNFLNAALKIYTESGNQLAIDSLLKERDEILK